MSDPGDDVDLRIERLSLSRKRLGLALLIFAIPIVGYCCNFAAIVALGWPWALPLCILGAWFTGMAFIVGHDACHQSFTASARLNGLLGRIALLPSLHSFGLWDLGHNRIHHRYNNVRGFDYVFEPMSPEDYRRAGPMRRWLYRTYRHGAGLALYYMVEIWWPKMFLLRRSVVCGPVGKYVADSLLVWAFLAVQVGTAVGLAYAFGRPAVESVLLAVLVPFLIWNALMSFVIYLHHTHPDVPWYGSVEEWQKQNGRMTGTVHVELPWIVSKLMLNIMEHNAHHFAPGVPLYNLTAMQERLDIEQMTEWRWTPLRHFEVTRRCKLFNYAEGRWVGYASSMEPTVPG